MKFVSEASKKEPVIELYLEEDKNGVTVVGKNGSASRNIISFRDGKFYRCTGADLDELESDEEGRIIEEK